MTATTIRPLYEISREIQQDPAYRASAWCAGPYVSAMGGLCSISDRHYDDDGRTVVLYALSNLSQYRGDTARRVKAELRQALKS